MINVLIPMAGAGSRFSQQGFTLPKPLIDVNGAPMIVRVISSLGIKDAKFLFVIAKNEFSDQTKDSISSIVQNPKFIEIDYVTRGPANSALLFKDLINTDSELLITNCDQIMEWDSDKFLMHARQYDGCIVTYTETTDKNSYAEVDNNGLVVRVKEKEVISNISLNGIHYWKHGTFFVESAERMIAANDTAPNGEFYIGPSYNYMTGLRIGIYHIPNTQHHAVGVPADLEKFIKYENSKNR